MKNFLKSTLMWGAILFGLAMCLTSCEGTLDDVFGEWSRPSGNNSQSNEKPSEPTIKETPLTLEALTAGTIKVNKPRTDMQYSKNGGAKTTLSGDTDIEVAAGDKVQFYGKGTTITNYYVDYTDYTKITGDGTGFTCKVYGNIMSLVDEENFATATTLTGTNNFSQLFFNNSNITDASGLQLPVTTMTNSCYSNMFRGCTSLTTAPALPASNLAESCYSAMFYGCSSLTTAPELKATTLAQGCYNFMFGECSSLTTAPELLATQLDKACYDFMFSGCTSLTTAPAELPATTLADNCYKAMFSGCTSLTTAPKLPATTLKNECYRGMFSGCTSLTTAYVNAAYTVTNDECKNMFDDCTETAVLHTTSGNQGSWDGVMGATKTWSTWTTANDWTD